jgi:zinc transport system ATP-binding protein
MKKNTDNLLSVKDLKVTINEHLILDNISFDLKRGESLAVIGPNGAGKSVLLKSILGLIPYQGNVLWKPGIKIGYVPQRLSIEAELPLTTKEFFQTKSVTEKEIIPALESVGFDTREDTHSFKDHVLNNKLSNLSGGEIQRVLIAWALINSPDVLLFDEPTSGVDISSENTIYSLLEKMQSESKLAMILISHELQVVYKYSTNVLCLNKERVCFGPPLSVLNKNVLEKLYGKDKSYVEHHH